MLLDQLQKQEGPISKEDAARLYKITYTEAYKEGQRDQKEKCGCDQND